MDIRFLKSLTPNVGYLFNKHIHLSSTPSVDGAGIGIGQVIRNHTIYVPIYGLNSPYHFKKIVCQEGGSNKQIDTSKNAINDDQQIESEILPLNETKKIDKSIKISFQHPIIRTKTLQLNSKKKPDNKKFKFNVVD